MTAAARLRNAVVAGITLAVVAVSPAQATNAYYFRNTTDKLFVSHLGEEIDGSCTFGPTGVFIVGPTGALEGSIRMNAGFFCPRYWGTYLAYDMRYRGYFQHADGSMHYYWDGGVGAIDFTAYDPSIGKAWLDCAGSGESWERAQAYTPIESTMTMEVDGLTCTVSWLPGAQPRAGRRDAAKLAASGTHTRITSSAAHVEGRDAHVKLQAFGRIGATVVDHVTIRDGAGAVLGRGAARLRVGDSARAVPVRLTRAAAARIERRGHLVARVRVRHREGHHGTGDDAREVVLRPEPELERPQRPTGARPVPPPDAVPVETDQPAR